MFLLLFYTDIDCVGVTRLFVYEDNSNNKEVYYFHGNSTTGNGYLIEFNNKSIKEIIKFINNNKSNIMKKWLKWKQSDDVWNVIRSAEAKCNISFCSTITQTLHFFYEALSNNNNNNNNMINDNNDNNNIEDDNYLIPTSSSSSPPASPSTSSSSSSEYLPPTANRNESTNSDENTNTKKNQNTDTLATKNLSTTNNKKPRAININNKKLIKKWNTIHSNNFNIRFIRSIKTFWYILYFYKIKKTILYKKTNKSFGFLFN